MRSPLLLLALVATVVGANALTATFGLVTVLGLTAIAGTWLAGFVFLLRDGLHETGGRPWVLAAIVVGAVLSAALSPQLALASAAAFVLGELADYAVYVPLRRRSRTVAVIVSNTAGAVLDTVVFLAVAGFPLDGTATQVVVKVGTTTAFVLIVRGARALLRQPLLARYGRSDA